MGLAQDISTIKRQYRERFQQAQAQLLTVFSALHAQFGCADCQTPAEAIDTVLHAGCGYREWQKQAILTLERDLGKRIKTTLDEIETLKEQRGSCHQCGACCSLASSEFDFATLQRKAESGDNFAQQFTSIFLPYDSQDAAKAKFPEIVAEILSQTDGDVHFYYCPHLGEDNRCTIYNDPRRPQICKDYPATPLTLMHSRCGYLPWKRDTMPSTLLAHATLELCHYYANRILEAVKSPGEPVTRA